MFKKRLLATLMFLLGVPLIVTTLFTLIYWTDRLFPCDTKCEQHFQYYVEWILGIALSIGTLYVLYLFIDWLFIEPYKAYKNKKQG